MSPKAIDVQLADLHIVKDATSYTGYRWKSLHHAESGIDYTYGLPVTPFELTLYRYIIGLRNEVKRLKESQ